LASDCPRSELRDIVQEAGQLEVPRLERHLPLLAGLAYTAPLLGLLGTVLGLLEAFYLVSTQGGYATVADVSGAAYQSLISAAAGLAVAIPALIATGYLSGRVKDLLHDMERAGIEMVNLIKNRTLPAAEILAVDGEPADATWTNGWLEPVGPVGRRAVTVELVAHVPLEGPEHTVVLTDGMVGRERFDRTDVAFRARQGGMLMACGTEREPADCATQDLGFVRGSALPTRYTARLRFPGRTLPAPFARALRVARDHVTLGAGALLLAGMALATWNRARRRPVTSGPPVTGSPPGR
jgi:hypothetical protein